MGGCGVNRFFVFPVVVALASVAGCNDPIVVVKVFCEVAKVVMDNTEAEKIKKEFGEGSFGEKVCELFTGVDRVLVAETQQVTVPLPTKLRPEQTVSATVIPNAVQAD